MCKLFFGCPVMRLTYLEVDINNVGLIVQALLTSNGDSWDEKSAATAQAYQVSVISLSGFSGRLFIGTSPQLSTLSFEHAHSRHTAGFLADYLSHAHNIPRATCFILCSVVGVAAQTMLVQAQSVDALWNVSTAVGMSYGMVFALYPALALEYFGIRKFDEVRCEIGLTLVLL